MIATAIYDGSLQTKRSAIQELLRLQMDALNLQIEYIKIHGSGLLNREFISDVQNKNIDLQQMEDMVDSARHLK